MSDFFYNKANQKDLETKLIKLLIYFGRQSQVKMIEHVQKLTSLNRDEAGLFLDAIFRYNEHVGQYGDGSFFSKARWGQL